MHAIAASANEPSFTRKRGKRMTVSCRIAALLTLVLLLAFWCFSQFTFPGAVTGSSSFTNCPALIAHC